MNPIRRLNARRRAHHHALRIGFWLFGSTFCGLAASVEFCGGAWGHAAFHLALMALCLRGLFRAELENNQRSRS